MGVIYTIVGAWGRAAIEWLLANPFVVGPVLLIWLGLFFGGKAQLKRLESHTDTFVLEEAPRLLEEEPHLRADELYDQLYPQWCQTVRRLALFVPHRWELWPLPATPSIVRKRIGFTPEWLYQYLQDHGFELRRPKRY